MDQQYQNIMGLLGMDEEKVRQQQLQSGLLSAGLQLLAGSGYSPVRRTTGELLGQAGAAGMQGYQQAGESAIDRALKGMQVKQMVERQQREKAFQENIKNAYVQRPVAGLGIGADQMSYMKPEIEAFGAEGIAPAAATVAPTERVLDQGKFMSALAEYNPLEYAKMMIKQDNVPEAIRTLQILNERPELLKTDIARRQAAASQINLPQKTQQELMTEVYTPQVTAAFNEAKQARDFATTAGTVSQLLKGKGGGELVRVGTVIARNLGFGDKEMVAANDLAESLAVRGATTMRAPGSGSTSDLEFNAYREAFPSLRNSDPGRQIMAKYATKFADRAEKIADYKAKLLAQGKYSLEAVAEFDRNLGPVLDDDFTKFMSTMSSTPSSGGKRNFTDRR